MISRSTRRGLGLAAILAALTWWLVPDSDDDTVEGIEGLDTRLDYALEDFDMRAFDESGMAALRLWAPRLTNEAATGVGRVEAPRVEVHHEGFLWNIIADHATISNDQEIVLLEGAVRLERTGPSPADRVDIDTSEVTLVVNDRLARSSAPVRIADPAGELKATGFEVDLLRDEFQLFNDVEGVYVTPEFTR
jgi:LPS export ABC transporter protein LptC